ncbi:MAG TPA: alpha/beta hydrolase [Pirellulales bacterium]|nr:alpha/beta hydrolase [Pirellulales bacterium]
MIAEIVQAITGDGLRLHGALHQPSAKEAHGLALDALLLLHGAGGNFYGSGLLTGLIARLTASGLTVLSVNTRGHDAVSTAGSRKYYGAAFEVVDDCRYDIAAWLEFLVQRGYQQIGLAGHSLGAVKAIYYLAHEPQSPVRRLVAISPPRLSHARFLSSPDAAEFSREFAVADDHMRQGRGETIMAVQFPLPYLVSAAGYLDKYGPEERYNLLNFVDRVACPMLFTFGTIELRRGSAFEGLPEELPARVRDAHQLKVAIVSGADHFYSSGLGELAGQIEAWLVERNSFRSST